MLKETSSSSYIDPEADMRWWRLRSRGSSAESVYTRVSPAVELGIWHLNACRGYSNLPEVMQVYQASRSPFKNKVPVGELTVIWIAREAPGESGKTKEGHNSEIYV